MKRILFLVFIIFMALGCTKLITYNLKCSDSIKGRKIIENKFIALCPQNCTSGSLWGSKSYTTDSSICKAGIHSGVITLAGGKLKVEIVPGQTQYDGSEKNGVIFLS